MQDHLLFPCYTPGRQAEQDLKKSRFCGNITVEKQPEDLNFFPVFGLFAVLYLKNYRRNQAFIVSKIFTSSSSWMMYGTMEYM